MATNTITIDQSVAILVDGNNVEISLQSRYGNGMAMVDFDVLIPRLLGNRSLNRLVYFREGKSIRPSSPSDCTPTFMARFTLATNQRTFPWRSLLLNWPRRSIPSSYCLVIQIMLSWFATCAERACVSKSVRWKKPLREF